MSKLHIKSITTTDNPTSLRDKLIGASVVLIGGGVTYAAYKAYKYYKPRMSKYKLTYFNSRGIAEPIRFMFALAEVPYEDYRFPAEPTEIINGIQKPAAFVHTKETYPFAQVPVLQVNGVVLAQSRAIERYLAKQFGFLGSNDIEAQQIDAVVEHLYDLTAAYRQARQSDSISGTNNEVERYFSGVLPAGLRHLSRFAKHNGRASDHSTLVGSSLSLADICTFYFLSMFPNQSTVVQICTAYPELRAIRESVANQPQIKNWIRTRPATEN